MTALALFAPSVQTGAILGASIAILGAIGFFQSELSKGSRKREILLLASLVGLGFCIAGFAVGTKPFAVFTAAYIALDLVATVVALLVEWRLYPTSLLGRLRYDPRGRSATLTFAGGLVLLIGTGVMVGILVGSGSGAPPPSTVFSSDYRVSGTCANGACTVNTCADPAPCGLENEGRISEGTPVDIVCQTKGEMATSPDDHRSRIWDRLSTGLYISDLFVEGTRTNRYTPSLPRCAIA